MIFWIFFLTAIILISIFSGNLGEAYLWYCIAAVPASVGMTALISLLLGRPVQYKLTSIINYTIKVDADDQTFYVWETDEKFNFNEVDDIVYTSVEQPTLRVFRYGLVGWRDKWLWSLYPHRYELTLFLPTSYKKDET